MSDRFGRAGADGYDQGFGSVSGQFVASLLRLARIGSGHRVLDIATGSGVAAAAAVDIVGPAGRVVAADVSPAMLEKARQRIGARANVALAVEDGQALTFPDCEFDAVVCAMGLMFFADPARGLAEFRRVLRDGGWAAVSVNTTPERAFVTRVDAAIGRHVPERAAAAAQCFSLGDARLLHSLFATAGFRDIAANTETRRFPFASFSEYFAPIEGGQGPTGQIFAALPADVRQAVREDVRRQLQGEAAADGPVEVVVDVLTVCGRR